MDILTALHMCLASHHTNQDVNSALSPDLCQESHLTTRHLGVEKAFLKVEG